MFYLRYYQESNRQFAQLNLCSFIQFIILIVFEFSTRLSRTLAVACKQWENKSSFEKKWIAFSFSHQNISYFLKKLLHSYLNIFSNRYLRIWHKIYKCKHENHRSQNYLFHKFLSTIYCEKVCTNSMISISSHFYLLRKSVSVYRELINRKRSSSVKHTRT